MAERGGDCPPSLDAGFGFEVRDMNNDAGLVGNFQDFGNHYPVLEGVGTAALYFCIYLDGLHGSTYRSQLATWGASRVGCSRRLRAPIKARSSALPCTRPPGVRQVACPGSII